MGNTSPPACCPDLGRCLEPRLFKALSDPNRIAILARLTQSPAPCTVSQIAECCPVSLSVVSRHLATLREAGVLEARKRGKEVYYSVRFDTLVYTLRLIAAVLEECGPTRDPGRIEYEREPETSGNRE